MSKPKQQQSPGELPTRQSASKGFGQIIAGNGLGQLVTFFALPILSRLYSPSDFGLLSLTLSIAGLLAPLALLGMHLAVVVPRQDSSIAPLAISGLSSLVLIALILGVSTYLWSSFFIHEESLRPFLTLALPALLIITGINLLLGQLVTRTGTYGTIGQRNGLQSISITVAQLVLSGTAGIAWINGLISGTLIGSLIGVFLLLRFAKGYARRVPFTECADSLKKYWRFPAVFAPTATLAQLSHQAPLLFAIYLYGTADGGQVGMAERLVSVPLALLGLASSTVLIGELSYAVRNGTGGLTKIFLKTSRWLSLLGISVLLGLAFLSTWVVPAFLGEEWELAARVSQLMAVVAFTRIVSTPIRDVFGLLNHARLITYAETLKLTLVLIAIAMSFLLKPSLLLALGTIYAALAIADIALWLLAYFAVRKADKTTGV